MNAPEIKPMELEP